jgi:hypothetical protein
MSDRTVVRTIEAHVVDCTRLDCTWENDLVLLDSERAAELARVHDKWHEVIEKPLPPGRYAVELSVPTGNTYEHLVPLALRITDGPQKGRVLYDGSGWFELANPLEEYWVEVHTHDSKTWRVACHEAGCTFNVLVPKNDGTYNSIDAHKVARRHGAEHAYDTLGVIEDDAN